MPAASFIVPAAASVIGAGIGAFGQAKATSASSKANEQALAFQREQEASRKASFDTAMKQYESKWNAWNNSRNALLQRYGIDIGSAQPTTGNLMGGGQGAPAQPPGAVPRPPQGAPMGPGGQESIPMPQGAQTVGAMMGGQRPDLGQWSNWRAQGLQA